MNNKRYTPSVERARLNEISTCVGGQSINRRVARGRSSAYLLVGVVTLPYRDTCGTFNSITRGPGNLASFQQPTPKQQQHRQISNNNIYGRRRGGFIRFSPTLLSISRELHPRVLIHSLGEEGKALVCLLCALRALN